MGLEFEVMVGNLEKKKWEHKSELFINNASENIE